LLLASLSSPIGFSNLLTIKRLKGMEMAAKKKANPDNESLTPTPEVTSAPGRSPRKTRAVSAAAPAKKTSTRKKSAAKIAELNSGLSTSESNEEILRPAVSEYEQIELLAYSFWEARGCQGGSPEEDWYQAEQEFRRRREMEAKS
jgi:hypothetical protein